MTTYGVLGVGSLASFVVTGLCDGVDDPPPVVLSPRNAEMAARLAATYPTVTVAQDNQAVLDASEVVLVLLRRQDVEALLDLTWRPEHVVVAAVAGLPVAELGNMVRPARQVARAVAMPAAATRSFRTPVHPPVPAVLALFERLGGALPIADGAQFEAIYTSMGTFAPFFEYLTVLSDFLVDHGVSAADAQLLLASTFVDVARPLSRADPDFADMVREYAPPGGGNEQLTTAMREEGVFEGMRRAIETVHERLSGG